MIKHVIILLLILASATASQGFKSVAVLDSINITLQTSQIYNFSHRLSQHHDHAFMLNVNLASAPKPFPDIEIVLENRDQQKARCRLKYETQICVLERSTDQVKAEVRCLSNECKVELVLSQRVLYRLEGSEAFKTKAMTIPGEIYKVNKQQFNSILEVFSELKELRLKTNQIKVYSNVHAFRLTQVPELDANSAVFGLKPILHDNDQYFYVESEDPAANKQLRISFKTHQGLLKDGVSVVDFIETFGNRSVNTYGFDGSFSKNIVVYARIFAGREETEIPFGIVVEGRNNSDEKAAMISQIHLPSVPFGGQKFYDISWTITKEKHSLFKIISFNFLIDRTENKTVFLEMEVQDSSTTQVHIFDDIYFSSAKDQDLSFAVVPQAKYEIVGQDKQIPILINPSQKYLSNSLTCSLHKGCAIEVKSTEACEACGFKLDLKGTEVMNHIIYYQVQENQIEGKVDFEESLYFKKSMQPKKVFQVVANTPNIMVYASFEHYERCPVPSPSCHQFAINQQNPMLLSNHLESDQALVINIFGLEKARFTVRLIENMKGLSVTLGEKFSYLFDDEEKEITLEFVSGRETFTEKDTHLNFNLISPVNSLELSVENEDGLGYQAVDGYIQFAKKDIAGDKFKIRIKKIGAFVQEFVHMTLIVSTSNSRIRLDSTSTHYEKYLPGAEKKYIIEYNPDQQNLINIFTENLERVQGKMRLRITDINLEEADEDKKPFVQKTLQRDNEAVDLDLELENVDICEDVNCQLEITITSLSKHEHEQSITVLHEESVILLEDSIWASFEINDLTKSNHFYYLPRQQHKPIQILFETDDRNVFIDFLVHNANNSLNPQNWPWDHHADKADISSHRSGFQQFTIPGDSSELSSCWPHCVILITVGEANRPDIEPAQRQLINNYKILVSSTVIEVPEDTKFQVTMNSEQENSLFIEVNSFIKSEAQELTFFTEYKVGRARIVASLLSQGKEYSLGDNDKPFVFEEIETHLPMATIRIVLDRYHLNPEQTSLKVTMSALSSVQMYFEFTSYMKNFYRLRMDDLQVATLREGQEVWYQFIPERDFSIKFYRAKGFPLLKVFECQEESYIDCLSKHKKMLSLQVELKKKLKERTKADIQLNEDKQNNSKTQLAVANELELFVDKNYEYTRQLCDKCIVFIWVYCYAQDLQLSINIRSSTTELELKEMAVINDRLDKINSHNKYLINVQSHKSAIVTFRVIEGECSVELTDSSGLIFNQTFNSITNDYKDINVEAVSLPETGLQQASQDNEDESLPNIPPVFKNPSRNKHVNEVFRHLHVKVTSTSERPVEYLLSYSIGFSGVYLEDGVVTQRKLLPEVGHVFFYHNKEKKSHAYLSLSSTPAEGYDPEYSKNEYEVRFFYYPDANRRDVKEEFVPQMPPKKNENYLGKTITHVYELPARFQLFEIELYTKNYLSITASINHKELIYLPVGFQYLIKLHRDESIYIVVDRPPTDYLELSIKKCDTSVPTLYYTNDAREFQEGLYEAEEQIQNSFEKKLIKTKKSSKTIHLKLTAQQGVESLFTVSVLPSYDPKKTAGQKVRPGGNGRLSYRTLDTSKVEVEFSPVSCDGKECSTTSQYYLLVSESLDSIYGQLNCAGTYMVSEADKMTSPKGQLYEVSHKNYDETARVYRIVVNLSSEDSFIGVKAIAYNLNKRTQVMYNPTEISTIWKQMSRLSIGIFLLFSCVLALILTLVVVISTKLARRGYRPISAEQ